MAKVITGVVPWNEPDIVICLLVWHSPIQTNSSILNHFTYLTNVKSSRCVVLARYTKWSFFTSIPSTSGSYTDVCVYQSDSPGTGVVCQNPPLTQPISQGPKSRLYFITHTTFVFFLTRLMVSYFPVLLSSVFTLMVISLHAHYNNPIIPAHSPLSH